MVLSAIFLDHVIVQLMIRFLVFFAFHVYSAYCVHVPNCYINCSN